MYNDLSVKACGESRFSTAFRKPLYATYSFARITDTILQLLTGKSKAPLPRGSLGDFSGEVDTVVFFFVDGFGWEFFQRFAPQYPFLTRFIQEGTVTRITSQFPSTTAAHVTSICTGEEVGQTGVYEWFYYEPLVDRMIAPLPFAYAGDHEVGTLEKAGVPKEKFFPTHTFYEELERQKIRSYVFQQESIAHTPYSEVLFKGAKKVPYASCQMGLKALADQLNTPSSEKRYLYFYFGDIDSKGHRQGIDTPAFLESIDQFWKGMEAFFEKTHLRKKTALLLSADHGMVPVYPEKTLYLNQLFPEITSCFKTNRKGEPLVPAGSCRDFFLHVQEEKVDQVLQDLNKRLKGVAEVYRVEELIRQGFFGLAPVSALLLNRIGNLVILPYAGESVWWYEKHRFEQHFKAAHGGLSPQEMDSIFLSLLK
jgi:hypothetical protein